MGGAVAAGRVGAVGPAGAAVSPLGRPLGRATRVGTACQQVRVCVGGKMKERALIWGEVEKNALCRRRRRGADAGGLSTHTSPHPPPLLSAGTPWPYGPYGHYPVPYAVAAQYAATGYAPGGAPLAGWGVPAPPPPGWQQAPPPPGWGGQHQ